MRLRRNVWLLEAHLRGVCHMLMINLVLLQNQFFEPVESVFGFSPIAFPPPAMYGGGNCGGLLGCQPPPTFLGMRLLGGGVPLLPPAPPPPMFPTAAQSPFLQQLFRPPPPPLFNPALNPLSALNLPPQPPACTPLPFAPLVPVPRILQPPLPCEPRMMPMAIPVGNTLLPCNKKNVSNSPPRYPAQYYTEEEDCTMGSRLRKKRHHSGFRIRRLARKEKIPVRKRSSDSTSKGKKKRLTRRSRNNTG